MSHVASAASYFPMRMGEGLIRDRMIVGTGWSCAGLFVTREDGVEFHSDTSVPSESSNTDTSQST